MLALSGFNSAAPAASTLAEGATALLDQSRPAPVQTRRRRALEGSLHILAPAIAGRAGAELTIGGDSCYATYEGKPQIHIAALPPDDEEANILGLGHTWHEANHIQFSDFEALNAAKLTGAAKAFHNALEDIYSDAQGFKRHPGARPLRNDLMQVLQSKGRLRSPDAGSTPAQKLEGYVYWRLAHEIWQIPSAESLAQEAERLARDAFSLPVVVKVDAMMSRMHRVQSSTECIELARRIVQLIEDESEEPPPPEEQPSQGEQSESNDPSQADGAGQPGPGGSNAQGPTPEQRQALKQVLQAADDEHMQDIGSLTSQAIEQHARDNRRSCVSVPSVPGGFSPTGGAAVGDAEFDLDVRASSNAIRQRCARLLLAKTQGHIQRKRTGSTVSHRHLATYAAGDPRIFIRRIAPEISTDTGVVLLADRSGSTYSVINVIRESLYASALALEAISGVSVAAAAFPSINDGVIPLKHFSQRAPACSHQFARLTADGGTPMAEAMLWAGQQLAALNKPRKLLLVVTDGAYPESLGAPTVRALSSCGINSYAIGVGHSADVPWFPFYKKITDIAELPQAMNDVLMFALKHEGMRQ